MADLNRPKINMKSDKYIFKKKLTLKRKSKKRLFVESSCMFILSLFIVYINYLIPNKFLLLKNLPNALNESFILIINIISKLYEIFLVIFIFISLAFSLILLIGSLYRLFRITSRKTKNINYK